MHKILARIVGVLGLGAIAWSAEWSIAEAKEVSIPVQIVVTHLDEATVRWEARVPDIAERVPELNAGDTVTALRIESVTKDLGTWERTYRRFSHQSCHTSWFQKRCKRYYANDSFKRTKSFDVPSDAVALTIEFVHGFAPEVAWHPGEYSVANFLDKPIKVLGPLEMTIKGGIQTEVPQAMDGAVGDPVGPVRLKTLVGKDGPAPWFTLVVDFEAANMVNIEGK
ncbi:hypothetical protein [Sinorhizobium sp. CCBAU 05631]|uniref:hypothetical protein n=1 Tax=Sinorhizobium sp. CCBAU 05631 TaxID=794846 RepID=UPI0004B75221|nr:hypothetical protein [Sinorhizobium sp. CCBAU 05631]ASY61396.1 hypothetical protein SS05631_d64950 [Sinorhizobium sp. CCBAU 05631]